MSTEGRLTRTINAASRRVRVRPWGHLYSTQWTREQMIQRAEDLEAMARESRAFAECMDFGCSYELEDLMAVQRRGRPT